ncbi:MAG: tetratricopeptide repeat protein [Pseudomonadota bacterium]|nr:tetratricopeptide repeat protein [Pseudomonadota bacterium]
MGAWVVAALLGCGGVLTRIAPPPAPVAHTATAGVPARARYHYLVGRLALEDADWAAADAALQTALLHDPNSPWIWLALADAAAGAGEEAEARRRVQEAVRLGPDLPETWTRLGDVAMEDGDVKSAIDAYVEAVDHGGGTEALAPLCRLLVARQDPLATSTVHTWSAIPLTDLEPLRERGRLRLLVGDLPGAVADLGEALVRAPGDARLLDEYLTAVTGSGLYRQGLARLAVLHRLAPRDTDVLLRTYHLAASARDQVRAAEALEALDGLLGGREAQVKLWLADAYSALGRHDEARAAIDAGRACKPTLADAAYHRARILRAAGRSAEALQGLEVPESGPSRADAYALRARLYIDLGRLPEARAVIDHALAALPDDYALLGALVAVEAADNHREAMLAAVDRMAMLDPEARARTRARSLAGLGDVEGALAALRAAGLTQPESWIVGGALLREAGQGRDAVDWLTRGVDHFPRSASLRAELGLAQAADQQAEAALLAMREAIRLDPADARAVRWYVRTVGIDGPADRLRQVRGWVLAALERQPADAELLAALGRVEYALKQPLRAVEALEEACRYAPADDALLASLAEAYRAVGRDAQANAIEERIRP